jgi:hypothetical protein
LFDSEIDMKGKQRLYSQGEKMKNLFEKGTNLLIRTVTYHQIGRFEEIVTVGNVTFAILSDAVWCADSGRFTQAVRDGKLSEVELFPEDGVIAVNLGSVSDICEWRHPLPDKQK